MSVVSDNQSTWRDLELERERFRHFARLAVDAGRRDGLNLRPFESDDLPFFSALDTTGRAAALVRVECFVKVAAHVHAHGNSLRDCKKVIWSFLKAVKLTPPADLLDRFEGEDCIDVYGFDHQMIFANPTLLNILSYTLEELYCRPWMELFHKSDGVLDAIHETIEGIMEGTFTGVIDLHNLPEYAHYEISSEAHLQGRARVRFFSPLFNLGEAQAYLCVNRLCIKP